MLYHWSVCSSVRLSVHPCITLHIKTRATTKISAVAGCHAMHAALLFNLLKNERRFIKKSGNAISCKYVLTSSTTPIFTEICIAWIKSLVQNGAPDCIFSVLCHHAPV